MSTFALVLLIVVAVLAVLFVGGLVASGRRARATEASLHRRIEAANAALADAHAQDKGWQRDAVEAAARQAFAARHPGEPIDELHLVQVVDRPGTDSDEAVFRVVGNGRESILTLGRRDGAWVTE